MSIPVELSALAEAMARYRFAYLLTSSSHGAPHALAVTPVLRAGRLDVGDVGRKTRTNAQARPEVGLVWPPQSVDEYSLIVDGVVEVTEHAVYVTPTRAVLHRPAPALTPAAPGACGSDCVELSVKS
ncbi:MAG: hypothetical protein EPN34_13610 [Burkholderiaceae bacterium]|jgi:hypothetical protein|nr:MAG: hypothetical protein EPN34_13610 [Burkholderiaceae bacterium]